jgi:putative hemolysin
MTEHGYRHLVGCASVGMADGGRNAVALNDALAAHLAPPEYRVLPRHPLPLDALRDGAVPEVPPLLRGYLRAGAWICGAPAWDPDFNTADFPVLLAMDRLDGRHARHFGIA